MPKPQLSTCLPCDWWGWLCSLPCKIWKAAPVFAEGQCSCCWHAVCSVAVCVGASGPGPESPFSCPRVARASVENGECSWIRDFYTWVCASLLGLEWSKTSMFHFAQSLASHPLSRVKSMAESFTLKPQKTNPTPVACESYLQRPGNSQNVVYEAHSQSGLRRCYVSCFFSSHLWASDHFAEGERHACSVTQSHLSGQILPHDARFWLIPGGRR